MNNALLIQKIEASELSIPRKEHKPAASVNFNIPKQQMVLPNDPNVEPPVVEINRDVYSYRNAVTAAPKLNSVNKIDPKSFANENHDASKQNSPKLSQSQEKTNIQRRDNTHNSNDENLKEDNEIKSSWTTVVKRKPYKRPPVICTGSKEVNPTSKVKGVIKRKWVYVGKIYGQDVTEIDMKEFLIDSTGTEDFVIKKLSTKGSNSAFTVAIPSDALFELLLKPESWPNGEREKVMNQGLKTCQKQGLVNTNEKGHIDVGNKRELEDPENLKTIMNHENRVSMFHVNVQCLSNKLEMIELFLSEFNFDIICFSEHWQTEANLKIKSANLDELSSILSSFDMKFTIQDFTRVTTTSATCIDNILTNFADRIYLYRTSLLLMIQSDFEATQMLDKKIFITT
ncbi:hypothetical protein WA026_016514 [Henosepilachna vigintioctopunctata]|uniref:Uncharacterized protein n=1 Tax=Henosepilachna vigintioctopunctata TaxID=420089 RepID=A0AAW1V7Q1_9CUCU